jgi:hypothetical protein
MFKHIALSLILVASQSALAAQTKPKSIPKAKKAERAPAGVTTELPTKRSYGSSSGLDLSESRMAVTTALPDSRKTPRISAAAELSTGQVDSMFSKTIHFTQLVPQLNAEVKDLGVAYVNLPFTHLSFDDTSARTIGRPQLGAAMPLALQNDLALTSHADLQLPFYDSSRFADDAVAPGDAGRSWGVQAGGDVDYTLAKGLNHLVGGAQLSYDTPSRVMYNGSNMDLIHPVALRTSIGVARHAADKVVVGIGLHAFNELYDGRAKGGGLDGKANALELTQGEVFGRYDLQPKTRLQAGLVKGLKTSADPLRYPLANHVRDLADFQLNVSMLQSF